MFTATRVQVATYLLGVCPFSIAFLVFLNSSVSFVVTDLIGQEKGVGDAVGNLGFADELLALVACPLWGLLSDRIGVRYVRHTNNLCTKLITQSGLCVRLCHHHVGIDSVRAVQECLPSTSVWQATVQSRGRCSINHGHGNFADDVVYPASWACRSVRAIGGSWSSPPT